MPEGLPPAGAEREGGLFLFRADRLHDGDQLTRHKGKGDEHRRQRDAGDGKNNPEVVRFQPRAQETLAAEQHDQHQTRDHRRHRERQVDERNEHGLAAKVELGDEPGRGESVDHVQGQADGRHQNGQANGRQRIRVGQRVPVISPSLGQRLNEHIDQRQQQEDGAESERHRNQTPPRQRRLLDATAGSATGASGISCGLTHGSGLEP